MQKKWIKKEELAEILKLSPESARKKANSAGVKKKNNGRVVLFDSADVEKIFNVSIKGDNGIDTDNKKEFSSIPESEYLELQKRLNITEKRLTEEMQTSRNLNDQVRTTNLLLKEGELDHEKKVVELERKYSEQLKREEISKIKYKFSFILSVIFLLIGVIITYFLSLNNII